MPEVVTGSCMCRRVQFELTLPTKWCAHCHCLDCRHAHTAAFVTWCGIPSDSFRWVAGEDHIVVYRSSAGARRTFCKACGATMLFEGDRWPGEIHVALGCLDGEIDRAPQANTYWDRHPSWAEGVEDLPKLGGENGNTPIA
jgi:hypothetical protein